MVEQHDDDEEDDNEVFEGERLFVVAMDTLVLLEEKIMGESIKTLCGRVL